MNTARIPVAAVATAAAAAAVLAGPRPVAVAGGLLLAFVLPGLALTAALFGGREVSTAERVVLTPVLSLAVLVVGGLLLTVAGVPLQRVSWTAVTAGTAVLALLVAALPRRAAAAGAAAPFTGATVVARPRGRRPWLRVVLPLAVAVAALGAASAVSWQTSRDTGAVTALSAAPPGPADAAGRRTLQVEVTGLPGDGAYTLQVRGANGRTTTTRPVTGTAWRGVLLVSARERTTVTLHRTGDPVALRTLTVAAG